MSETAFQTQHYSISKEAAEGARVRDYVRLLKPRVMSLVVFSGFAGLFVAPGPIHPFLATVAILCIAIGSGAAGAINMWYDRDIDQIMSRTRGRPIPRGVIAPEEALTFGVILSAFSVMLMAIAVNFVAAALLASAILFYVFIYTMWLKRATPQNIVIGGAAGAFPPMIGWAAVTGGISVESVILFTLIFFWTPPHFWALALYRQGDYAKAGVPMLPVVAGPRHTQWQMLTYTVILLPLSIAPTLLGMVGWFYGAVATGLSLYFLWTAVEVIKVHGDKAKSDKAAKHMFAFSILYLFGLLGALCLDVLGQRLMITELVGGLLS